MDWVFVRRGCVEEGWMKAEMKIEGSVIPRKLTEREQRWRKSALEITV
jgi:hypothetical protein